MGEKGSVSRRSFLMGSGVVAGGLASVAALAGCSSGKTRSGGNTPNTTDATATANNANDSKIWEIEKLGTPSETISADVCIVGAGGTGTAAAIQAIDLGLKPVVIERMSGYGGSFIGTEGMTALETKYTEANGPVYFSGAYWPNQPYGVQNATNTCINYHHWIPQHKLYENLKKAFMNEDLTLPTIVEYAEIFWIYNFALQNKGLGFSLPHLASLEIFSSSEEVVAIPLDGIHWRIVFVWPKTRNLLPHEKEYLTIIKSGAKRMKLDLRKRLSNVRQTKKKGGKRA